MSISYLLARVSVEFYFTRDNKNTNDFFRDGKSIPWWATVRQRELDVVSLISHGRGDVADRITADEVFPMFVAREMPLGIVGLIGTGFSLLFVNPDVQSLFDTVAILIGLFISVSGGLIILDGFSTTANARGAFLDAPVGLSVVFSVGTWISING